MAGDLGDGAAPNATQPQASDPRSGEAIRQSARWLARDRDAFTRQLHYNVAGLIPDYATAPSLDTRAFCNRMVQSLLWAALTDQPLPTVIDSLRQVGAQNWFEGFPEAQYASLARALVQSVRSLSGNAWSASMGSAWIGYFMWIRPHLLAGARQAAARQPERHATAPGTRIVRPSS